MLRSLIPIAAIVLLSFPPSLANPDKVSTAETSSEQSNRRPTAFIHYPKAALGYFLKAKPPHLRKCLMKFKMTNREEMCTRYLSDAVSFSLLDDTSYISRNFQALISDTLKNVSENYIENFYFDASDGNAYAASAQLCIVKDGIDSWAISPGCHAGVLFVYVKLTGKPDNYRLSGLLEQAPFLNPKSTRQELEWRYVTDRIVGTSEESELNLDDRKVTRSLCDLDRFERFRVCSVCYLAWLDTSPKYLPYARGYSINLDLSEDQPKCIKRNLHLEIEVKNKNPSIDVLPCAIHTEAKYPEFFVTNDPFSSNSVFMVRPVWTESTSGIRQSVSDHSEGFQLKHYMADVKALNYFPESRNIGFDFPG